MATVTINYSADFPSPLTNSYTEYDGSISYGFNDRIRETRDVSFTIPADLASAYCSSDRGNIDIGFGRCITNMGVSDACTYVVEYATPGGGTFGIEVQGDGAPYLYNGETDESLDLKPFLDAGDLSNGLNPVVNFVVFTCEEPEPTMTKIWNKTIMLQPGNTTINLWNQLVPPPDVLHYILWQGTIQITAFDAGRIDWTESNPRMYKFGALSSLYFGSVNERQLLTAIDNYFGLYETLPTIQPVTTVAPGTVTFGQRLTTRKRCNGLGIMLLPTVTARLDIRAMQIFEDMAEYI